VFTNILGKTDLDNKHPRFKVPLQSFRVGLLQLLGNIEGKSSYMDLVGTYMVKKLAGTVENTFHMIDVDGNGVLDQEELKKALYKLGVRQDILERDVKTLMKAADTDKDGVVSLNEFKNWYMSQKVRAAMRVEQLFRVFDEDNDGYINKTEFKALLTAVNGSTPPTELLDKTVSSPELINLADTITWFESLNPIEREVIVRKSIIRVSKASVVPAACKLTEVQTNEDSRLQDDGRTSNKNESKGGGNFLIHPDTLPVDPIDEDDTLNISFPFGESWMSKLRWAFTIPLVFPLWCTLYDVRQEEYKKYFSLTFIGSMVWLGIFSFLMV